MSSLLQTPAGLLLVQLTVILALSRLLGAVARRLHQPLVVAEIGAGVVLGPSVLGALAPDATMALFPPDSLDTLHALSHLALLLFMLLVGLRLDAGQLFRTARTSFVVSQTSMIAPFLLSLAAASWLYGELSTPEVPFVLFALFVALSMSVTALPVLARMLRERRLLDTRVGVVSVASAAIDDIAAWCLLALVVSVVRAGDASGALTSGLVVAALGIALFGIRPLLARIALWVLPRRGITDGVVAGILVFVLAACVLTETLGLHALFVAFALGAVMPREGGLSRALGDRLEGVTTLLLMPLFFAYSGLRTDVALLGDPRLLWIAGAVFLIGSVGKIGGGSLGARWSGLSWRDAATVGVLVNMRGLMQLVVINVGLDLGLLTPSLFAILVLTGLATTVIAAPLLRWLQPTSIALRAPPAPWSSARLPTGAPTLLCVPSSKGASAMALLSHALGRADSAVYALNLRALPDRSSAESEPASDDDERDGLSVMVERAAELGAAVRTLSFVSTDPGEDICRTAAVKGADLVLLGSDRALERGQVVDATALHVLQSSSCTVAVLVAGELRELSRLLVVRGAADDGTGFGVAARIARRAGVGLEDYDSAPGQARPSDSELVVLAVDVEGRTGPEAGPALAAGRSLLLVRSPAAGAKDGAEVRARLGQDVETRCTSARH